MPFFNTTNETGEKLAEYKEKAMTQDEWILLFFENNSYHPYWTPSQVWNQVRKLAGKQHTPLTSVRRSMNTLTKQGKLIKTDEKREGIYGRLEHVWKLADPKQGELL